MILPPFLLPIIYVIWVFTFVIVSWSVTTRPFWPFPTLSMLAEKEPAASIFAWGFNMLSFWLFCLMQTKYSFLEWKLQSLFINSEHLPISDGMNSLEDKKKEILSKQIPYFLSMNTIGWYLMVFYCISLSITSTFNSKNYNVFHTTFAFCFFLLSFGHCWMITRIHLFLRKIENDSTKSTWWVLRTEPKFWIMIVSTITLIVALTLAISPLPYSYSALGEYLFLTPICVFYLSFVNEFRKIRIETNVFWKTPEIGKL